MADMITGEKLDLSERRLIVSHCNCFERAMLVKDQFLRHLQFKDSLILDTTGIGSLYAQDGGIVVTY